MKKYILAASLFVFNCEVISWLALVIMAWMFLADFFKALEKGGFFK